MAVVLISGGAGGIGSAVARHLVANGDAVALADVDRGRAEQTAATIGGGVAIALDVTDPEDCDRAVAELVNRHGRVDGVVCCAAVFAFAGALDVTPEDFDRTLKVNVHGSLFICQAAARAMIVGGHGGSLVLLSSGAGGRSVGAPAYSTSKGAIDALTRELALAWAPHGIRVNAVAPGVIETEMSTAAKSDPETFAWFMGHTALGRTGEPEEVAAVVAFLLGDASSYVTGSVIPADGGFLSH